MRLLLDTHVLLWWLADRELDAATMSLIADPQNEVAVSAATAWEISIKKALGKLRAPEDLAEAIEESGFNPLVVTIEHAVAAGALVPHHDDPFDRMLIAQAQLERYSLVSRDERLAAYDVELMRV